MTSSYSISSVEEWSSIQTLLSLFCEASRLEVSKDKSCFIFANVDEILGLVVSSLFGFKMVDYTTGFKYLGFSLKPSGCSSKDWKWLL